MSQVENVLENNLVDEYIKSKKLAWARDAVEWFTNQLGGTVKWKE